MDSENVTFKEMNFNKYTLSFPEKEEILFRNKYFNDSIIQLRAALLVLMVLYALFGLLDFQLFPKYVNLFHKIRFLIVIPIVLTVFFVSFTKIFHKIWQTLVFICYVVGGTGISVMTMVEPENFAYYPGMMLIFSAGYFFVKLRYFTATLAGWSTLLLFNLIAIFYANAPNIVIINANFFFISANLIGMFAGYNIEFQIRRNFSLNQKLDSEKIFIENLNKNLEIAVEERTKELVKTKQATEAINSNITAIIEGTTNSIWAFNKNYEILYINHIFQQEFYKSFNVHLKQGVNLIEALPENLRPLWKPRYDRVLNNEQFTIEDEINAIIGKVYLQVGFTPIVKNGEVIGGSCFGSNITSQKLSEVELLKAKESAEKSDKLKSAFLANMSHEIRTPMNGILGFSSLLQEPHLSDEKQQQYISIIEKSGKRMLNILNDIMDISKIEAGLMKVYIKETNINKQIDYIYSFFKHETESKGLLFSFNKPLIDNEAIIKTDPDKLYAILANLVKNAIKYTNEGSIEFGYTTNKSVIEFYIKDTGIGIPREKQHEIFERFIQADITDKMARQGAGLGLSISKSFLEMLDGTIRVESEENIGSTFYFTLPYSSKTENSMDTIISVFEEENKKTKISGLKIVIAEDDESSASLLSILVENLSKETIIATTGDETVTICRNNPDIDVVFMDIQMPNLNGFEATKQIREFNKDVIIIAQTAFGLSGDKEKTIAAGCNDYISKPIKKEQLFAIIQKYFNK